MILKGLRVSAAEAALEAARAAVASAEASLEEAKDQVINCLELQGWTRFVHASAYYGHHEERGEGDIYDVYLFPPGTLIPVFPVFSHGSSSDPDAFEIWLEEKIEEGVDYYEF